MPQVLPLLLTLLLLAGCTESPAPAPSEPGARDAAAAERTFVRGSSMRGANGIHFGPDGLLYVASVVTPAILAVDPDSGEIVERLGPDDHATAPDDLAFDSEGSLYWTNISFGTVGKRDASGSTSVIADLGPGVNPITLSPDDRLFVSQCFMGTGLYEVDPSGEREPRSIRDDLGPNCGLNGMDWGPDGRLWGPRWFRGEVVSLDVDTGTFETPLSGFLVPAAVKFDSQGRLHVLDAKAGRVYRIEGEGREVVAEIQPGLDNLAFSADDRLFVSSFADGAIWEVLSPDENRVVLAGGLNMPGGLALSGDTLFVADFFALRALDATSGAERHVERDVIGFSDLGSAMSVHASTDGSLVLSSWFDNAVRIWDPISHQRTGHFELPVPIDALRRGDELIATLWGVDGSGSVVALEIADPTRQRTLLADLDGPAGLTLGSDGTIYVTERRAGRLLELSPDAETPRSIATDLQGPEGIAIVDDEVFLVETEAGRVLRIAIESGERSTIASELALHVPAQGAFPDTMLFGGIAARPSSEKAAHIELFVSGDRENVLYRFVVEPRS